MKATLHSIAVLTAQLTQAADGWQQLLPKGEFRSRDGSPTDVPHWFIDEAIANRLIEGVRALKQDVLVDYDHETIIKAKNGIDAGNVVAAGWFSADEAKWFDDEQRQGLFIKPRWTPKAYQQIKDGEFAFLSAVFSYDENGIPLELRMAALTNDPGVTGMQRLAVLSDHSLSQPKEETRMNKLLQELLKKLGIELADGAEPSEEQANNAKTALDALISGKADAEAQVATLNAKVTTVDFSKYVPKETYDATVSQLAVLSAQNTENGIAQAIDKARNEGRVLACEADYLTQFGKQQGLAELNAMLASRQPIAVLSATQTSQMQPPANAEKGVAVLSAADKEAAKLLGISEEEFAKQKETE